MPAALWLLIFCWPATGCPGDAASKADRDSAAGPVDPDTDTDTDEPTDTGGRGAAVSLDLTLETECWFAVEETLGLQNLDCEFWNENTAVVYVTFRVPPGRWRFVAQSPDEVRCDATEFVELAEGDGYHWVVEEFPGDYSSKGYTCTLPAP